MFFLTKPQAITWRFRHLQEIQGGNHMKRTHTRKLYGAFIILLAIIISMQTAFAVESPAEDSKVVNRYVGTVTAITSLSQNGGYAACSASIELETTPLWVWQ